MKKFFKYLSFSLVLVIGVLLLTACGSNKDASIVGTWKFKDKDIPLEETFVFNKDNTGSQTIVVTNDSDKDASELKFTYKKTKDKILITYEDDADISEFKYKFKGKDLILYDTSGSKMTFIKK